MFDSSFDKIVRESAIDFPRPDLDLQIWLKEDNHYFLREEIKNKILGLLDQYPEDDLLQTAREIRIVGSITCNLYTESTDIDVHIIPEDLSIWSDEDKGKAVKEWYEDRSEELEMFVGEHIIEFFIQPQPHVDLLSVGVYDLLGDVWLKGPKIHPMSYDPYEDYGDIADDIRNAVQGADIVLGELKRDVIDFEVISKVLPRLPKEAQKKLQLRLKNKLEDIEKDIQSLKLQRKSWVKLRRLGNEPIKSIEDLKNSELVSNWENMNIVFKFIARYHYMDVIKALENLLEDDSRITPGEIDIVKGIMKDI